MYLHILSKDKKIKKIKSFVIIIGSLIVLALITNYLLQYFHFFGDFIHALWWISEHPATFLVGSLFIFFIYIFVLSLFGNLYLSSFICLFIFCAVGFSDINKLTILGEPLYPVDFYQVRYISSLFKMIGGKISLSTLVFCLTSLIILVYILRNFPKLYLGPIIRFILLCISSFMIYSYVNFNTSVLSEPITKSGVTVVLWNQSYNYDTNGFVFGLLSNLQTSVMEQPEGYSEENIKAISEKYIEKAKLINSTKNHSQSLENPNIIFVMNETFWDPTKLPSLTFSEDPMKNIRQIMNSNLSGHILSPEFGGNTANVEFEALTGLSMYNLLPGSIPYQQVMDKEGTFPSLINMFKERGYNTLAIHPYNKCFYKRNRVYNYLGFDEFIGENDLRYKEFLSKDSYISDQSVVNEILYQLKKEDNPLFIHSVTMQNHTPLYDGKYGENTISISGLNDGALTKELETYSEGIKQSDLAIKNLVDNITLIKEPTLIVFWGDHLPALNSGIYEKTKYPTDTSCEAQRGLSETPLFVYSNFDIKKIEIKSLSPSFLGTIIYDLLDIPISPYFALLQDIRTSLPGLKTSVLIDSKGNTKNSYAANEEALLKDYKLIQYDLLVGKKYSLPILFK